MKSARIYPKRSGLLIYAAACFSSCMLLPMNNLLFAQETTQDKAVFLPESQQRNSASPEEVRSAILSLQQPIESSKIAWINQAIFEQSPAVQNVLQKELNAKLDELFKPAQVAELPSVNPAFESVPATQPVPAAEPLQPEQSSAIAQPEVTNSSFDQIKSQIDALRLGNDANVEDLRERDRLVGVISGITDPKVRFALIDYLENKERSGNSGS